MIVQLRAGKTNVRAFDEILQADCKLDIKVTQGKAEDLYVQVRVGMKYLFGVPELEPLQKLLKKPLGEKLPAGEKLVVLMDNRGIQDAEVTISLTT